MLVFDRAILKRYWPADDKGEEGEIIRTVVVQIDAEVDNSRQVGELFNNMVRGLVRVTLEDNLTGDQYTLPAVTIKPFSIKQKKVKLGQGDDVDVVKSEFAGLTLTSKLGQDGGTILSDLYRYFNIELQMTVEEFRLTVPNPPSSTEQEEKES
ncbi:MAG TPA: hypothetical protein PKN04_12235 [bacterium]|jgi:hypothetical protein|nr:hypothetical protein [bacterium]HNT66541.1 hypothetical protein [bacterium]HOX86199.1 hypothetical protein [bacterium]HPG45587.1 hypothetical protein [bacterium]HPM97634.1 hypothetical protein [bacterium]